MSNQTDIRIRKATRADVSEIVRLLANDPLGSLREKYQEPLPQAYYEAFAEIDSDPHHELVVVEKDGEIIGTLQLTFLPGLSYQGSTRALVEAVRVDERHRNSGIGAQLMAWAIDRAREKDCYLIQLTTHNERPDAHRFYLRLGFTSSHTGMKLVLK